MMVKLPEWATDTLTVLNCPESLNTELLHKIYVVILQNPLISDTFAIKYWRQGYRFEAVIFIVNQYKDIKLEVLQYSDIYTNAWSTTDEIKYKGQEVETFLLNHIKTDQAPINWSDDW